jgi:cation transport ATPase
MIRDYIRGMQMAYFPPFKMFFLLFTLTILVESGLNIQGINRMKQNEEEANVIAKEVSNKILTKDGQAKTQEKKAEEKADKKLSVKEEKKEDLTVSEGKRMFERMKKEAKRIGNEIDKWCDNHMSFVELILVLLFSWPLWLLIRHSPAIPDLRLSECFVAMVYISNMLTIYGLIPVFLCLSLKTEIIFSISTLILAVIAIKQLSGYSYLNTIWRMLVAIIPFFFMILFLFAVGYVVLLAYAYFKFI